MTKCNVLSSSDEYNMLLSNMGDFIYQHSPTALYRYLSPSVLQVTGYGPEEFKEIIQRTITDHPVNRYITPNTQKALRGEEIPPYLIEIFHKNGQRIMLEISERPCDYQGEIWVIGVVRDVTNRAAMRQEAQRLRGMLENIVNAMPSTIITVDPDINIMQWNQKAQEQTGKNISEVIGVPLPIAFPRLSKLTNTLRKCVLQQQQFILPRETITVEDQLHYMQTNIFPLPRDESGNPHGAVIRIDDITEQVRMEQMMVQTEKMMSLGGLAAGMAHEINNPLGGIVQSAQNISRRISKELPANQRAAEKSGCSLESLHSYLEERQVLRMLEGIKQSAVRAAEIVTNMLTFSRKSESEHRDHNINQLLENTVGLASADYDLKKSYDFRHITIQRDFDTTIPYVPCNQTEIEQVVLNLLRNAAQAMTETESPTLTLTTKYLQGIPENPSGHFAQVSIQDNGPGISPEGLEKIFEPFYTTKEPGVGTGLGLSVSFFIITENHKGYIRAISTVGEGTTFTLILPTVRQV